jgi:molybdate transport system substrate-binding protein
MKRRAAWLGFVLMLSSAVGAQEPPLRLYAAGSLTLAMTQLARTFTASGGPVVNSVFGASGLLRERIEHGEAADIFASADVGNAEELARAGKAETPVVFARNRLCALLAPGVEATSETLLDRMLDPAVKLGTSTPKADPSGDYAWQVFQKADALRPGAFAALAAKALQLTGGPQSPRAPPGRSIYSLLLGERKADLFLTYCTNARQAILEVPGARMLALPDSLTVGANYALTVIKPARLAATQFALFVLSTQGQEILALHGFTSVAIP